MTDLDALLSLRSTGTATLDLDCPSEEVVPKVRRLLSHGGRTRSDRIYLREKGGGTSHYSDVFGAGAFPFHTDFAFERRPPRYVILQFSGSESDRPTLFCKLDLKTIDVDDRKALRDQVWEFRRPGPSMRATLLREGSADGLMVRLDPVYMRPLSRDAGDGVAIFARWVAKSKIEVVHWVPNKIVLFDNWRVVHARGSASGSIGRLSNRSFVRTLLY